MKSTHYFLVSLFLAAPVLLPLACKSNPTSNGSPTATPVYTPTVGSTVTCLFPALEGRQTVAGSLFQNASGNIVTCQVSIPGYVGLQTIWAYLGSASGQVRAALYADNGGGPSAGAPSTLIAQSSPQAADNGWNTIPMPATYLYSGYYWLALQLQGSTSVDYASGAGNTNYASNAWGGFPSTYPGTGIAVADTLTMYAMVCNFNTPTNTATPPFTPTHTGTFTYTPTPTDTSTKTATPTNTGTPTSTFVCSGASGKIGSTSGATSFTGSGYIFATRYQFSNNARVTSIDMDACSNSSTPATFIVGIYSDSSGCPGTLMGPTASFVGYQYTCVGYSTTWNIPLAGNGIGLPAGYYWLAIGSPNNAEYWGTNSAPTTDALDISLSTPSLPTTFSCNSSIFTPEMDANWVCP